MSHVKLRILLADDQTIVRAGVRLLLEAQPDLSVVGEASDVAEALALAETLRPDIALVDINLRGAALTLIPGLRDRSPETRVVVLTLREDPTDLHGALTAGAVAYVVKRAPTSELLAAIRVAARGGTFVEPTLAASLLRPAKAPQPAAVHSLSRQERRVLQLLAEGHTNQAIADAMTLSVKTVETYRARLSEKLRLRTRAELFRFAVDTGLLDLSAQGAAPSGPRPQQAREE